MGYVAQCNGTSSDIVRHNFPLSPFLGFMREEGPNLTLFAPIFFGNNWSRVELGIFSWEGQLLYCSLYLKKCLIVINIIKDLKKKKNWGAWLPHPLVVVLALIWRLRNQVIFPITS